LQAAVCADRVNPADRRWKIGRVRGLSEALRRSLPAFCFRAFFAADRERANTNTRLFEDDDAALAQAILDGWKVG
jgi:hypothetical protein